MSNAAHTQLAIASCATRELMLGAKYRTANLYGLLQGDLPNPELFGLAHYYATPDVGIGSDAPNAKVLPARPTTNGQAEATGGPLWAAERDGAELVSNVEHIRGLSRAKIADGLLDRTAVNDHLNPWSLYGSEVVWAKRIEVINETLGQVMNLLMLEHDIIIPKSEVEQFDDALRSDYQSEPTAQLINDRNRSVTMPPRTLADATTQISGWLAEVAMSHNHLHVNIDTGRRADSGKFDDGGEAETEKLENAYKQDAMSELDNSPVGGGGKWSILLASVYFGAIDDALNTQQPSSGTQIEYWSGVAEGFFKDGLWGDIELIKDVATFVPEMFTGWLKGFVSTTTKPLAGYAEKVRQLSEDIDNKWRGDYSNWRRDYLKANPHAAGVFESGWLSSSNLKKWGRAMMWAAKNGWQIAKAVKDQKVETLTPEQEQILIRVEGIIKEVERVAQQVMADAKKNATPRNMGRIVGMVAYELVSDALLAFATAATGGAGAGAAAPAAAAKAAKIARKLDSFSDAGRPIKEALKEGSQLANKVHDFVLELKVLQKTCFVAGTPLLTPDGDKPIEQFRPGDRILGKAENDPAAPVRVRIVEEVFELEGLVLELRVGGQLIETTSEHPFFVAGQGWVRAKDLQPGDPLVGHDERITPLTSITRTEQTRTVYNLRVSEDHTYFVGSKNWGFSIWVHNAYSVRQVGATFEIIDDVKDVVRKFDNADDAHLFSKLLNDAKVAPRIDKVFEADKVLRSLATEFPHEKVGFRGSLARGTRFKDGLPFDPRDFDCDAFIVSDKLAKRIEVNSKGHRPLGQLDEYRNLATEISTGLKSIPGHRTKKTAQVFVYTEAEFAEMVMKDAFHLLPKR